jgi:hypothetical protein
MIPIVIVENVVNYVLIDATGLPKEGLCAKCILSSFLQSYVVAGLFEETVKYCAVRRIINKSYVVDPRALVVYSCCAGQSLVQPGGQAPARPAARDACLCDATAGQGLTTHACVN